MFEEGQPTDDFCKKIYEKIKNIFSEYEISDCTYDVFGSKKYNNIVIFNTYDILIDAFLCAIMFTVKVDADTLCGIKLTYANYDQEKIINFVDVGLNSIAECVKYKMYKNFKPINVNVNGKALKCYHIGINFRNKEKTDA